MRRKAVFRTLAIFAVAVSLVLVAGWGVASNMGFKLNYGIINSVNHLLLGSGVSLATVTDNKVPPRTSLVVGLDLESPKLAPQNSNMGFKLFVASLPAEGLEVVDPSGNRHLLQWNGSAFTFGP